MPFSKEQIDQLNAPLMRGDVKARTQGGRQVSYIESWHAIAEANRIFGFDRWSSETIETKLVVERERLIGKQLLPGWGVTYTARVRVTVDAGDMPQMIREGYGAGHGIDQDLGQAHESAIKEAESDAQKRALRMFGNPFGLALYDKTQANVADEPTSDERYVDECRKKIASFPDSSTMALTWWQDEEQRQARRNFDLTPAQVELLKQLVIAKLPAKEVPNGNG